MAKTATCQTWIRAGIAAIVIAATAGITIWWLLNSSSVYIDSASVEATQIALAPSSPGILQDVYVQEGDVVPKDATVARVGNELVKSKVAGIVVSISNDVGSQVSPNESVVTMIDPSQLRVVGEVDENKGLDRIKVGAPVTFTVDAFGSKQYSGVIDDVSPTSRQSGIVFNISDKREVKQFDVKARFDVTKYPELKNGMSARMWVYDL